MTRVTLLLLGAGILLTAGVMSRVPGFVPPSSAAVACGVVAAWLLHRSARVRSGVESLRAPSARQRALATCVLAGLGTGLVLWSAKVDGRGLQAYWHDELSTMVQVRMLLSGRLWMPQHPLADFFETFHVLVKPVYASMYFPGAALLLWPAAVLHVPPAAWAALLAGAFAAVAYRVLARATDGVWGIVGALVLMSVPIYRSVGSMFTSHLPAALLTLTCVGMWVRWREQMEWRRALALGMVAGAASITRPVDAFSYLLPLTLATLLICRQIPRRQILIHGLAILLGAIPFGVLQLIINRGVTGAWTTFPQTFMMSADAPLPVLPKGVRLDPSHPDARYVTRPASRLVQKQVFFDSVLLPLSWEYANEPLWETYFRRRLVISAVRTLPHPLFIALIPLGVYAVMREKRPVALILMGCVPAFLLVYAAWPYYLKHYLLPLVTPTVLLVVAGARQLCTWKKTLPNGRPNVLMPLMIVAICVATWPGLGGVRPDQTLSDIEFRQIERTLSSAVQGPAVVLFRYDPSLQPNVEPVYNSDVAWPDDADIIRARDLDKRNIDLFQYYSQLNPARRAYLYVERTNTVTYLGTVGELARRG